MNLAKKSIRQLLNSVGLEIQRKQPSRPARHSLSGLLNQIQSLGVAPATVFDVGAAYTEFTQQCYDVFPQARYVLLEPLEEYKTYLEATAARLPQVEYILAAAADKKGTLTFHVHPDLVGSSLYLEGEQSDVNGIPRTVPSITLDGIIEERDLKPPYFIKVDVQGAELDVLKGAEKITLPGALYVLLEVSCFQFFQDGPLFTDVIAYMKSQGFVPYDLTGMQYRLLDNALSQVDIAFVQENSVFRQSHVYAAEKQRAQQTKSFQKYMS
jgi:FkbM family methyltransferase